MKMNDLDIVNANEIVFSPEEVEKVEETVEAVEEEELLMVEETEFMRGVKTGSYMAGIFASLVSAGVPDTIAGEIAMNERGIEHNYAVLKFEQTEGKKQVAKELIEQHLEQL